MRRLRYPNLGYCGTVVHHSKLPLTAWFWAAYLMLVVGVVEAEDGGFRNVSVVVPRGRA